MEPLRRVRTAFPLIFLKNVIGYPQVSRNGDFDGVRALLLGFFARHFSDQQEVCHQNWQTIEKQG
jgi:hypothetical protein